MRRALLIAAVFALVAGGSAPTKPFYSLLGIVDVGTSAQLVALDPETLDPVAGGPSIVLGKRGGMGVVAHDGSQLVYASEGRLRFFNPASFERTGEVSRLSADFVAWVDPVGIAWITPEVVAVLRKVGTDGLQVVKVDAFAHAVNSRRSVAGVVLAAQSVPGAYVALLGHDGKVAPLRLLVVTAESVRVVRLRDRIRGGMAFRRGNPPVGTVRMPALAVADGTAYVADPSGTVVEVPLATLAPAYRVLHGRFAKIMSGATLQAVPLGDGLLAITGSQLSASGTRPAGLELVDTRGWTSRPLAAGASAAWSYRGGLLATGGTWDAKAQKSTGMGLAALERSGEARFRLFDGQSAWVQRIVGSRAYVVVNGQQGLAVVDLVTGRVVGRRTAQLPSLVLEQT
jgi:hypothetical protein